MSNTNNTYGSLPSVQKTILENEKYNDSKVSLIINLILIPVCIIVSFLLLSVYYKWQQIPYRKHFFQTEYIASSDTSTIPLRPSLSIYDAKILDISKHFVDSKNEEHNRIFRTNYELDKTYKENFEITDLFANKQIKAKAMLSYDSISKIIAPQTLTEVKDYCLNNNICFDKYKELFYYKHLDNESAPEKSYFTPHTIKPGYNNHCLAIYERNESILNYDTRLDSLYSNNFQAFLFSIPKNNGISIPVSSSASIKTKSNWQRFLYNLFKMEDISQSYYSIKLRSNSIPELHFKLDFIGTIECFYDKKSSLDLKDFAINYEDSNHQGINVGRSYLELEKRNGKGDMDIQVLVKFLDMQNMQSFRLFMLAALITLCLTQAIKSAFKVFVVHPIEKRNKRNNKKNKAITNDSPNNNEVKVNYMYQDDNDPPIYTLD